MIYDQINIGDVLEWKLMGNQSKMVIVLKSEEVVVYGSGKGKEKKWKTVFYVRGLYSFDEEPEPVDLADLKNNCKRPATNVSMIPNEDSENSNYHEPTYSTDDVEIEYDANSQEDVYQEPIYNDSDVSTTDDEQSPRSKNRM